MHLISQLIGEINICIHACYLLHNVFVNFMLYFLAFKKHTIYDISILKYIFILYSKIHLIFQMRQMTMKMSLTTFRLVGWKLLRFLQ